MQEFSALSVSSYEAGSLADRLTEQSQDGWSVVAIVPTGNTVTAYLCRESDGATAAPAEEPAAVAEAEPAAETTDDAEPALPMGVAAAATQVAEPAAEPAVETTPLADTSTVDTSTADTSTADTSTVAAATETAAAAGGAPAGWYADPSGRFELRYWDGGQWTEHVSRAGQQYTDPPVA